MPLNPEFDSEFDPGPRDRWVRFVAEDESGLPDEAVEEDSADLDDGEDADVDEDFEDDVDEEYEDE